MSITFHLSGHLKSWSNGEVEITVAGDFATVGSALNALLKRHAALRDRIFNETGEIRQHINIFAGTADVKRLDGLETQLTTNEIHIFNAVSGG
jgi:molybdopterin synthase sulfur carrier subunit